MQQVSYDLSAEKQPLLQHSTPSWIERGSSVGQPGWSLSGERKVAPSDGLVLSTTHAPHLASTVVTPHPLCVHANHRVRHSRFVSFFGTLLRHSLQLRLTPKHPSHVSVPSCRECDQLEGMQQAQVVQDPHLGSHTPKDLEKRCCDAHHSSGPT